MPVVWLATLPSPALPLMPLLLPKLLLLPRLLLALVVLFPLISRRKVAGGHRVAVAEAGGRLEASHLGLLLLLLLLLLGLRRTTVPAPDAVLTVRDKAIGALVGGAIIWDFMGVSYGCCVE